MTQFIEAGDLPNFRRLRQESTLYTTDAGEDPPNLEPWIQWITVHTGVPFSEHRVFHLGDAEEKLRYPGIGRIVSDSGASVGICGSMNAGYGELRGYVVPTHGADPHPHPSWLAGYYDFVASRVQESSRNGGATSLTSNARFVATLLRAGLSARTVWETVRQLGAECVDAGVAWRKACLLDLYQYDLFRGLNARYDVRFATFFSNCVAHYQHYYWRHMSPELFPVPPPASDHASLRDAIRRGSRSVMVLLVACSGTIRADHRVLHGFESDSLDRNTKVTYRPRDFARLLRLPHRVGRVEIFPSWRNSST